MTRALLSVTLLLVLAACTMHPPYACPLPSGVSCHSMQEIYDAARKAPRSATTGQVTAQNAAAARPRGIVNHPGSFAEPGDVGQPVFRAPHVYRPWLAPYVDADGNLRSGEFVYFATPGEWSYGTMREPGAASAATLFGPQHPDRLGFTPTDSKSQTRAAPSKPNDALPAPAPVTTREGITQPSETLTAP